MGDAQPERQYLALTFGGPIDESIRGDLDALVIGMLGTTLPTAVYEENRFAAALSERADGVTSSAVIPQEGLEAAQADPCIAIYELKGTLAEVVSSGVEQEGVAQLIEDLTGTQGSYNGDDTSYTITRPEEEPVLVLAYADLEGKNTPIFIRNVIIQKLSERYGLPEEEVIAALADNQEVSKAITGFSTQYSGKINTKLAQGANVASSVENKERRRISQEDIKSTTRAAAGQERSKRPL